MNIEILFKIYSLVEKNQITRVQHLSQGAETTQSQQDRVSSIVGGEMKGILHLIKVDIALSLLDKTS